jgi:hypothetical protein
MPGEQLVAEEALLHWRPKADWASTLREPVRRLLTQAQHIPSWATLAMVLGDTHAAGLCFLVCEHARRFEQDVSEEKEFLSMHQALAALDLGLAETVAPGPVLMKDLHFAESASGGAVRLNREHATEWLDHQLRPFDGALERAANFCLCLAATRTGLVRGPSDPSLAQLCDLTLWRAPSGLFDRLLSYLR